MDEILLKTEKTLQMKLNLMWFELAKLEDEWEKLSQIGEKRYRKLRVFFHEELKRELRRIKTVIDSTEYTELP